LFKMDSDDFKRVAIIGGAGRMGSLFARLLKPYYKVGIYDLDENKCKLIAKELNIDYFSSLKEAIEASEVIEVATPLSKTRDIIKRIGKYNCKDKLVFDIASFKSDIISAYKNFEKNSKIVSIHPMFGPGIKFTKNKPVLVIPLEGHENDVKFVKEFLKELEFDFIEIDHKTHDEIMSLFISMPYLISISYLKVIKNYKQYFKYGGASFKLMLTLSNLILNDSEEQIATICSNKLAKKFSLKFRKEMMKLTNLGKDKIMKEVRKIKNDFYNEDVYRKAYDFFEMLH